MKIRAVIGLGAFPQKWYNLLIWSKCTKFYQCPTLKRPLEQTKMAKNKKRLNLELTPEAYELLQKLSDESGKNMADVLRTGLALYGIASEEKTQGRNLAVIEDERVVKQIVLA